MINCHVASMLIVSKIQRSIAIFGWSVGGTFPTSGPIYVSCNQHLLKVGLPCQSLYRVSMVSLENRMMLCKTNMLFLD